MTSQVIIRAHCSDTKEVMVLVQDENGLVEEFAIQDGEETERSIYDGRSVSVMEVEKEIED